LRGLKLGDAPPKGQPFRGDAREDGFEGNVFEWITTRERPGLTSARASSSADSAVDARLAEALLQPLRSEAARGDVGDARDRRLLGTIEDVLVDVRAGLTPRTTEAAIDRVTVELPAWFERRRDEDARRHAEVGDVLSKLGSALKALHSDDEHFRARLEATLAGVHRGSPRDLRTASAVISRLVEELGGELAAQRRAHTEHVRTLSGLVRGLSEQLQEAKVVLATDPLTGLANRGTFDSTLSRCVHRAALSPYRFVLVMLDIDHFKAVNDTHGHVAGDRVLKAVARAVQRHVLRPVDLPARYGGEELAVLLDDSDATVGARLAETLRAAIEAERVGSATGEIALTASFGVAEGGDGDDAESVIRRADEALYLAKRGGRNRVVVAGVGEGQRIAVPGHAART
jgi:diguanylate cyclase (GGDEF)-like protein